MDVLFFKKGPIFSLSFCCFAENAINFMRQVQSHDLLNMNPINHFWNKFCTHESTWDKVLLDVSWFRKELNSGFSTPRIKRELQKSPYGWTNSWLKTTESLVILTQNKYYRQFRHDHHTNIFTNFTLSFFCLCATRLHGKAKWKIEIFQLKLLLESVCWLFLAFSVCPQELAKNSNSVYILT